MRNDVQKAFVKAADTYEKAYEAHVEADILERQARANLNAAKAELKTLRAAVYVQDERVVLGPYAQESSLRHAQELLQRFQRR